MTASRGLPDRYCIEKKSILYRYCKQQLDLLSKHSSISLYPNGEQLGTDEKNLGMLEGKFDECISRIQLTPLS